MIVQVSVFVCVCECVCRLEIERGVSHSLNMLFYDW